MIPSYSFCTPLPVGDPEYSKITQTVLQSYPRACITMIDRYENPEIRQAYETWRKILQGLQEKRVDEEKVYKGGFVTERPLDHEFTVYHGTKQQYVEGICKNGFRPEAGRVMAYGFGIYFATNFSTSWAYTNQGAEDRDPMSYIFICKILPGRIETPAANQRPSAGYHIRADNPGAPNIFAIPDPQMMIPEYLVRFHKVSEATYVAPPPTLAPGHLMTEKEMAREAKRLAATVKKLERKSKSLSS
jgi:hypothetical protein